MRVDGGIIANGSTGRTAALIRGLIGIEGIGTTGATVTNYGTISGSGGTAVQFDSGNDRGSRWSCIVPTLICMGATPDPAPKE